MKTIGIDISKRDDKSAVLVAEFGGPVMYIEHCAVGECIETDKHIIIGGLVVDKP